MMAKKDYRAKGARDSPYHLSCPRAGCTERFGLPANGVLHGSEQGDQFMARYKGDFDFQASQLQELIDARIIHRTSATAARAFARNHWKRFHPVDEDGKPLPMLEGIATLPTTRTYGKRVSAS
jgi:hypothetical protein